MLTETMVDNFVALAGPDFAWDGVKGCSRPPSTYRKALRFDLIRRQSGICFACGDMLDESAEFCHIVSRGEKLRGWLPGNIAVGHAACNTRQKNRGPVVRVADMVRPDVVPMEWTSPVVLRNM